MTRQGRGRGRGGKGRGGQAVVQECGVAELKEEGDGVSGLKEEGGVAGIKEKGKVAVLKKVEGGFSDISAPDILQTTHF